MDDPAGPETVREGRRPGRRTGSAVGPKRLAFRFSHLSSHGGKARTLCHGLRFSAKNG